MKGQYLALEAMMTALIGIMIAIGLIGFFSSYKSSVLKSAQKDVAKRVISQVRTSLIDLKTTSTGVKTVKLPENIGGSDYQLSLDKKIKVFVNDKKFSSPPLGLQGHFSGTVDGGEIKVFKNQKNYTIQG